MGAVFVARHKELGCLRAVKVIEAQDPHVTARFENEIKALARVRHPSVVRVHEAGREGSMLYFGMDLIEGGQPLDKLIAAGLPFDQALAIVEGAARGVHALHEAGLVHRDVKPANVMVAADGTPVVIDLGLAAAADFQKLTRTGTFLGTLHYMAPEQALTQKPPAPANDIYSLGAILYEAVTGSPPIEAQSPQELLMALASREITPPSQKKGTVARTLDAVCEVALHKEPEERYETALDFAEDVARVRRGEKPLAEPSRSRARSLLLVALVLLGAAALGLGMLLARSESEKTRAANEQAASELAAFLVEPWPHVQPRAASVAEAALALGERARAANDPALAARAAAVAAALALRAHDAAGAASIVSRLAPSVPVAPAVAGGIALFGSDSAPERAEELLARASQEERERGDLHLWRAIASARLGKKAAALSEQTAASALGYEDPLDALVVLALAGDSEEARRAIRSQPSLRDPAFARPFALHALKLVESRGKHEDARAAIAAARSYAPSGSPELAKVAAAIFARALSEAHELFDNGAHPSDYLIERSSPFLELAALAPLADPGARSPELATLLTGVASLHTEGSPLSLALLDVAVVAEPDSFKAWLHLAYSRSHAERGSAAQKHAPEAIARALALARTRAEKGEVLYRDADYHARIDETEAAIDEYRAAIAELGEGVESDFDIDIRGRAAAMLTTALVTARRWTEALDAAVLAEKCGRASEVIIERSQAHEGLGDVAASIQDVVDGLRAGLLIPKDAIAQAERVDLLYHRSGRDLDQLDGVYALIGRTDQDQPQRVALDRAALAIERHRLDLARDFYADAAAFHGRKEAAIAALRARLAAEGPLDGLVARTRALAVE
jgi:hypothetical protein